jgi:DNA repair photolyase
MTAAAFPPTKGRGSLIQPPNRFARIHVEIDLEQVEHEEEALASRSAVDTEYYRDNSESIITENDSPDVGFRYSLNPYRGCAHGCSYCFARTTHEYFDLSAGLDFETKVFVKERAPALLRDFLARETWRPEPIMMSGVTDCYQPAERHFHLTRRCLEVALEARQPICIVTKNGLVTRDLDLLVAMARRKIISVSLSITTLDAALARAMEPRTSTPAARLRTIQTLSSAGVPAGVMVAPVIPGLTDSEIPSILRESQRAGAASAGTILLRLPGAVQPVFFEWLERTRPEQKERIEARIRATRGGKLYQAEFGKRMRGTGELARQIRQTFQVFARRYGLDRKPPSLDVSQFRRPVPSSGQQWLFDA